LIGKHFVFEKEVPEAVQDWAVSVDFDSTQEMRAVPDHCIRSGIDAGLHESAQMVGWRFGVTVFHFMRVEAEQHPVGLPASLGDRLENSVAVARIDLICALCRP
jgi:hypothetical protein